jgi:hypothetical protein
MWLELKSKKVINVYELIVVGRNSPIVLFEKGLHLYQEGQFYHAREIFLEVLKIDLDDKPSKLFIERCDFLLKSPSDEWTGIWDFKT